MTPFQVFRRWLRRAPLGQKLMSATAAMAVLAALLWTVVPAGSQSGSGALGANGNGARSQSGETANVPSANSAASATNSNTGTGNGTNASGGARGSSQGVASTAGVGSNGGHCVSPPGSAPGVTATQINIAILIVNLAGPAADSTFGIESPQDQQSGFQAVINNINANGGVACRKLVPTFHQANPADQNSLQALCLTIVQSNVFAVVDPGAYANYAPGLNCYGQNHIPYFEGYQLDRSQATTYYPYLFSFDTLNSSYKNGILGLKGLGFFSASNGFKKLGVLYRDCYPDLVSQEFSLLSQVGVPSSDISSYDIGCPQALASPSDIENAVLKFQQAGVTNMTEVFELGDMATFTNVSQQQGFHPRWGIGDDGILEISNGAEAPNAQNMNGAKAITASRNGENNAPSLAANPTAGTKRCDAILQTVGLSPVYTHAQVGNQCDQLWMFQAAVDDAPQLSQNALAAGLQRAGSIDFSYPQGPNNFKAGGTTVGGQFWREDEYTSSCDCWQVVNPNWYPSF